VRLLHSWAEINKSISFSASTSLVVNPQLLILVKVDPHYRTIGSYYWTGSVFEKHILLRIIVRGLSDFDHSILGRITTPITPFLCTNKQKHFFFCLDIFGRQSTSVKIKNSSSQHPQCWGPLLLFYLDRGKKQQRGGARFWFARAV